VSFPPGRAYTGEPTVELWTHGSPPVLTALSRAAVAKGAVLAGPGEFTYRAVRHGRLDLTRAEAVRDLIAARTLYQARVAFRQVGGAVARRLAPLRENLVDLVAAGEAAIEFADESETHLAAGALAQGVLTAQQLAHNPGYPTNDINPAVRGAGSGQPVAAGSDAESRARNRRVEIIHVR